MDFGKVPKDQNQSKSFILKNVGSVDSLVKINREVSLNFSFSPSLQDDQFLISQGTEQTISMSFNPSRIGQFNESISFEVPLIWA